MANKCIAFIPVINSRNQISSYEPCKNDATWPSCNPRYCGSHTQNLIGKDGFVYAEFVDNLQRKYYEAVCYDGGMQVEYVCSGDTPGSPISLMGSPYPGSPLKIGNSPRPGSPRPMRQTVSSPRTPLAVAAKQNPVFLSPRSPKNLQGQSYQQNIIYQQSAGYSPPKAYPQPVFPASNQKPSGSQNDGWYTGPSPNSNDLPLVNPRLTRPVSEIKLESKPPRLELSTDIVQKLIRFDHEKDVTQAYILLDYIVSTLRTRNENAGEKEKYSFNVEESVVDKVAEKFGIHMNNYLRIELILTFLFYYESRDLSQTFIFYGFKRETPGILPYGGKLLDKRIVDILNSSGTGAFMFKPQPIPDFIKGQITVIAAATPRAPAAAAAAVGGLVPQSITKDFIDKRKAFNDIYENNIGDYTKDGKKLSDDTNKGLFGQIKALKTDMNAVDDVTLVEEDVLQKLINKYNELIKNFRGRDSYQAPLTGRVQPSPQRPGAAGPAQSSSLGAGATGAGATGPAEVESLTNLIKEINKKKDAVTGNDDTVKALKDKYEKLVNILSNTYEDTNDPKNKKIKYTFANDGKNKLMKDKIDALSIDKIDNAVTEFTNAKRGKDKRNVIYKLFGVEEDK